MLYLLDANVLIDANRDYYPIERVPQFWSWLLEMSGLGRVKIPREIFEEITIPRPGPDRPDVLVGWLISHEDALVLDELVDVGLVGRVTYEGYANNLTDDEIEKIGRDPFLIAYALTGPQRRCVVTTERSRPSRRRANRHIPDVCHDLTVPWCDTFQLIRDLDFRA